MAKDKTELPEAIDNALEIIRVHLDECKDIGEACEIQEQLEALAFDYDQKGTDLADEEAEEELG